MCTVEDVCLLHSCALFECELAEKTSLEAVRSTEYLNS